MACNQWPGRDLIIYYIYIHVKCNPGVTGFNSSRWKTALILEEVVVRDDETRCIFLGAIQLVGQRMVANGHGRVGGTTIDSTFFHCLLKTQLTLLVFLHDKYFSWNDGRHVGLIWCLNVLKVCLSFRYGYKVQWIGRLGLTIFDLTLAISKRLPWFVYFCSRCRCIFVNGVPLPTNRKVQCQRQWIISVIFFYLVAQQHVPNYDSAVGCCFPELSWSFYWNTNQSTTCLKSCRWWWICSWRNVAVSWLPF